jgi:hypothetical protein
MNNEVYSQSARSTHSGELPFNSVEINEGLWWEIKRDLFTLQQNKATDAQQAAQLIDRMMALHADLRGQPAFDRVVQSANTVSRGDNTWLKRLLFQDDDMYLQLITYFADYTTPIHDYPGLAIVNLPISGRMGVDYYHPGHAALGPAYPITKLRRTETHVYGIYEATLSFPWLDNIQEIRSITERCTVLSAGLNPSGVAEKSWYLPISPQTNEAFFAQRLKRNE